MDHTSNETLHGNRAEDLQVEDFVFTQTFRSPSEVVASYTRFAGDAFPQYVAETAPQIYANILELWEALCLKEDTPEMGMRYASEILGKELQHRFENEQIPTLKELDLHYMCVRLLNERLRAIAERAANKDEDSAEKLYTISEILRIDTESSLHNYIKGARAVLSRMEKIRA